MCLWCVLNCPSTHILIQLCTAPQPNVHVCFAFCTGPGAQLAQAWCWDPANLLLLPEQGPLSAAWIQQCMQQCLLPSSAQQQQHQQQQEVRWQQMYMPVCSTAGAAGSVAGTTAARTAAATGLVAVGGSCPAVEGCLTARQLIQLLFARQRSHGGAGAVQRLLLSFADRQLLESTLLVDR